MALEKVNYVDNKTVISAKNLNDIQDEIIANRKDLDEVKGQVTTIIEATVE